MLDFKNVHSRDEIHRAVFSTLAANGMRDNTHIRLTMSRGEKTTSSMNPNFNVFGCTLIVLAAASSVGPPSPPLSYSAGDKAQRSLH